MMAKGQETKTAELFIGMKGFLLMERKLEHILIKGKSSKRLTNISQKSLQLKKKRLKILKYKMMIMNKRLLKKKQLNK